MRMFFYYTRVGENPIEFSYYELTLLIYNRIVSLT